MESVDLDELVDRLRSITGYAVPATPTHVAPMPTGKTIDPASVLMAQQALRRHPAIDWLPSSSTAAAKGLLSQLRESSEAERGAAADASTLMQLLLFINETANELELERLSCVFADPEAAIVVGREKLLERLGLEEEPLLEQNLESFPSPWNVFFTLLAGPLFDCDFGGPTPSPFARGELRVPNATSAVARSAQRIHENVYDTEAWQVLLSAISQFPVASVRAVWQAALYVFPTSGTLATAYLQREVAELRQQRQLADCAEEDDAKAVLKATLRVLNAFYRHLPLTFSTDLYRLFFDFLVERVGPDMGSLDALYRVCLRRDVGNIPSSTELWTRYLEWRATTFTDAMRRREWVKRLYLRILQIPLLHLDRVKEAFESFVTVDLRGRFSFEEKVDMEKRFTRAKAEASEIDQLMSNAVRAAVAPRPSWMAAGRGVPADMASSVNLFLPRPLNTFEDDADNVSTTASREMELWASWQTLLERVERPLLASAGSEAMHYSRCRNYYLMRACQFPHQLDSWTDLVHFCWLCQPALREGEGGASTLQALTTALTFTTSLRLRSTMRLFAAHVHATFFHHPERASSHLKEGLLACRATLLSLVRVEPSGATVDCRVALQQLEEMLTLSVNWMRLGIDRFHVSMVARFVMHNVEFLSLTMAAVKTLLKSGQLSEPSAVLRPFNTFSSEWLTLELVRNRNAGAGLGILMSWKEHLLMMVKSAKGRAWGMASCGVDELFLDSCARLVKADPTSCAPDLLSSVLRELGDAAELSGVLDVAEFRYLTQLRRNAWVCRGKDHRSLENAPYVGLSGAHVLEGGVAPTRYDSVAFSDATSAVAAERFLRESVDDEVRRSFCCTGAPTGSGSLPSGAGARVYPEESSWPPLQGSSGGSPGAGGTHFSGPRQLPTFAHHPSQGRRGGGYSQPHGGYPHQRRPWMFNRGGGGGGGYGRGGGGGYSRGGMGGGGPFSAARFLSGTLKAPGTVTLGVKRARTLLADSRPLPLEESLGDFVSRLSGIRKASEAATRGVRTHRDAATDASAGDAAVGKESQRIPELGALERLIRELPLIGQYDPECVGLPSVSTAWLLSVLQSQEAIQYSPRDANSECGHS